MGSFFKPNSEKQNDSGSGQGKWKRILENYPSGLNMSSITDTHSKISDAKANELCQGQSNKDCETVSTDNILVAFLKNDVVLALFVMFAVFIFFLVLFCRLRSRKDRSQALVVFRRQTPENSEVGAEHRGNLNDSKYLSGSPSPAFQSKPRNFRYEACSSTISGYWLIQENVQSITMTKRNFRQTVI